MEKSWTRLAEAVNAIRGELERARKIGEESQMPFEVKHLEMEFTVGLSREAEGNASVKVWVFEAGGRTSVAREQVHTIRIAMQPKQADGQPISIGSTDMR